MQKVVTAAEMRHIEERAGAEGATPAILMERAGVGAAREILRTIAPGTRSRARVVVLCGPGNNGGDGLVVARELAARGVGEVSAYTYRRRPDQTPSRGSGAPRRVRTYRHEDDGGLATLGRLLGAATIIVDALLGTGRARPIEGELAAILQALGAARGSAGTACDDEEKTVVALDLPTGLDADTGTLDPHAVAADITLTFGFAKRGLLLEPGAAAVGRLTVVDIGLDDRLAPDVEVMHPQAADIAALIPRRGREANKYSAGAVLVVAGSAPFPGAPRLAALAAARAGAGLVTVATGRATHQLVAPTLVEMTFVLLPEDEGRGLQAGASIEALRAALGKYRCVLVGPGLGQAPGTQDTVYGLIDHLRTMSTEDRPRVVVDADGLNALAARPRFWDVLPPETILTPHAGEMARLRKAAGLEGGSRAVEADRLEVARAAARDWQAIVVLKGARTLVAHPDGRATINTTGGANLATAGTGDVLGGIIAALAAQGAAPFDAAIAGVYLHGAAGDRLARRLGDRGTLAGDLPDAVPPTLRGILNHESAAV